MRNSCVRSLIATILATAATGAFATANQEWLIRSTVDQPTAAELSTELGVAISSVEHVTANLYKVGIAAANLKGIGATTNVTQALREQAVRSGNRFVQTIQKNFVYQTALNIDAQARNRIRRLLDVLPPAAKAVDNPPIQAPNANPARGPDPKMSSQWALTNTHAAGAWAIQRGDKSVVVAVIDTGIDYNHEDLKANVWHNTKEIPGNGVDDDNNGYIDDVIGYDFADKDALPFDKMTDMRIDGNPGHGTHCSGVVGAVGNNALGTSGIAPNITVMGLRFITDKGEGSTADAVLAINYAVANGAKVISNSWGGEKDEEDDTELKAAIKNAGDHDVLMIFAAGNGRNGAGYDNDSDPKYMIPASYDFANIVSVAAIDVNNALGAFSNWGKTSVDLAAPGVKIMSTVPGNQYEDQISLFGFPVADWSGTSMATPYVAGTAGLLRSQFPHESALEIKARLLRSVTPVAALAGKTVTGGTLNAEAALR